MLFGLANALATFQAYINKALKGLLDNICVAYIYNIIVFSLNPAEHVKHVRIVLERLREYKLYANLVKCYFNTMLVEFLGFVVRVNSMKIDKS